METKPPRYRAILVRALGSLAFTTWLLGFSSAAEAQPKFGRCKPVQAAAFSGRIHVKCEFPVDRQFSYFAISSVSEPRFSNQALSLIQAALVTDKIVVILFNPLDESGHGFGCNRNDCRRIQGILLEDGPPPPPPPPPPVPPPPPLTRQQCLAECDDVCTANPRITCDVAIRNCKSRCPP